MAKIIVDPNEENALEKAIKKFKRESLNTKRLVMKHEYYLRPGLRMKEKREQAEKRRRRMQNKSTKMYERYVQKRNEYFDSLYQTPAEKTSE